jgi:hypothetical protein
MTILRDSKQFFHDETAASNTLSRLHNDAHAAIITLLTGDCRDADCLIFKQLTARAVAKEH